MSHRTAHNQVLSWHQPHDARSTTLIPVQVADDLVQRMAAERISHNKIRMFPTDSVYLQPLKAALPQVRFIPTKLPSAEVKNCKFIRPKTDTRPSIGTIREGWDWTKDPKYLPFELSTGSRSKPAAECIADRSSLKLSISGFPVDATM